MSWFALAQVITEDDGQGQRINSLLRELAKLSRSNDFIALRVVSKGVLPWFTR